MTFTQRIKAAYGEDAVRSDSGDLVQTVLIIAGFAIVAILVVGWIGTAIMNKGVDTAKCIEGSSSYTADKSQAEEACKGETAKEGDNSFEKDKGYASRYGAGG